MEANTYLYNLTNSKKSIVLNQNGENNKVMKYIGGDSIIYKNIYVQNENNLDYYGRIYENGNTLHLESNAISFSGTALFNGLIDTDYIQMDPSVSIGKEAGQNEQNVNSVAIGLQAAQNTQGLSSIAIGNQAGQYNQGNNSVAIGTNAATTYQNIQSVAIGFNAGQSTQGVASIAIGNYAGFLSQGDKSIAIGQAGGGNQGVFSIALGYNSGANNQGNQAVSIGYSTSQYNQGKYSIAIGAGAANNNQYEKSIALGYNAGNLYQGTNAIAIGNSAGQNTQGINSICIGANSSCTSSNSIVLNASGSLLFATTSNGFFVKPLRNTASTSNLYYDNSTGEITSIPSSQRYKHDIIPLTSDTSKLYQLEPKEFILNSNEQRGIGFIAEEADEISPELATRNSDGEIEGIQWNNVVTYLVAEIKKLKNEIELLNKK